MEEKSALETYANEIMAELNYPLGYVCVANKVNRIAKHSVSTISFSPREPQFHSSQSLRSELNIMDQWASSYTISSYAL